MCDPSDHSGNGEKHGVHIGREAHSSVDQSTVKVNVRIEFSADKVLIRKSDLFQFKSNLNQRLSSTNIEDIEGDLNKLKSTFLTILARGS